MRTWPPCMDICPEWMGAAMATCGDGSHGNIGVGGAICVGAWSTVTVAVLLISLSILEARERRSCKKRMNNLDTVVEGELHYMYLFWCLHNASCACPSPCADRSVHSSEHCCSHCRFLWHFGHSSSSSGRKRRHTKTEPSLHDQPKKNTRKHLENKFHPKHV